MKIVVTGAGGFVGKHLIGKLISYGHDIVALDACAMAFPSEVRTIVGDLGNADIRSQALTDGCDALIHLATVPGGAAEADSAASRRINIDAMYDLLLEVGAQQTQPRVVYASSIAVYGDPMPANGVDDSTPLSPKMIYGGHKAMMETAVTLLSNRGLIDGVTIRLPGILARPKGPSGMKSAFMSNLFHSVSAGEAFICPVSAEATSWMESVDRCAENFVHALNLDSAALPATRAVTLPALRVTMVDLVVEIARQSDVDPALVTYDPDPQLEAAFGAHPKLSTRAAEAAGFSHDGSIANLVASALKTLQ